MSVFFGPDSETQTDDPVLPPVQNGYGSEFQRIDDVASAVVNRVAYDGTMEAMNFGGNMVTKREIVRVFPKKVTYELYPYQHAAEPFATVDFYDDGARIITDCRDTDCVWNEDRKATEHRVAYFLRHLYGIGNPAKHMLRLCVSNRRRTKDIVGEKRISELFPKSPWPTHIRDLVTDDPERRAEEDARGFMDARRHALESDPLARGYVPSLDERSTNVVARGVDRAEASPAPTRRRGR